MKILLCKLTNTKTIISLVSVVILILTEYGIEVDNTLVKRIVEGICTIGILIGVMNDNGMKTCKWDD